MTTKNDATRPEMCVIQNTTTRELLKHCDWPVGLSLVSLSNTDVAQTSTSNGLDGWYSVIAKGLSLSLTRGPESVKVSLPLLDIGCHEDRYAALDAYSDYFDNMERQFAEERRACVLLVDAGDDFEVVRNLLQFALNFNSRYAHMRIKVCVSSALFEKVLDTNPFPDASKLSSPHRSMIWPKN